MSRCGSSLSLSEGATSQPESRSVTMWDRRLPHLRRRRVYRRRDFFVCAELTLVSGGPAWLFLRWMRKECPGGFKVEQGGAPPR